MGKPEKYDPKIMDQLLAEVGEKVELLSPEELEYLKKLLVRTGVYHQFINEQLKQKLGGR